MNRIVFSVMLGVLSYAYSGMAHSADVLAPTRPKKKPPQVVYPQNTTLDFEGLTLEGEVKNPRELYFNLRPREQFGPLLKRREEFHREMLRDVVLSY